MFDALGRHAYAVDAGWSGARTRPDWHAAYAYDRWRPTLFASYSDDTDPMRGGTVRSRELFAGALLPFRHLRWTETLLAGFDAQTDTLSCTTISSECRTPDGRRDLRSVRGGWLHDSRRLFGYSISPEEGFAVEAAAETSRTALGSDADAGAGGVRRPRATGACSGATPFSRRGSARRPDGGRAARGACSRPAARVRRIPCSTSAATRSGSCAASRRRTSSGRGPRSRTSISASRSRGSQRGAGTWPIFFRALHGAAFVDAGDAWDSAFRAADLRTSIGAELSLDRRRAPLPAADARLRRRLDARSRRRPQPRRGLRPRRLRVLATDCTNVQPRTARITRIKIRSVSSVRSVRFRASVAK